MTFQIELSQAEADQARALCETLIRTNSAQIDNLRRFHDVRQTHIRETCRSLETEMQTCASVLAKLPPKEDPNKTKPLFG